MYRLALLTLFALPFSGPLAAAEVGENHEAPTTPMAMNSMCPMCSKGIGEHPMLTKITVGEGANAKSFMIGMDTKECQDAFLKDPESGLKKAFGRDAPGPKTLSK